MASYDLYNPLDPFAAAGAGLPGDPMENVLSLQSLSDETDSFSVTQSCNTKSCGGDTNDCWTGVCSGNTTGCDTDNCGFVSRA
jgi:hypothetical protein